MKEIGKHADDNINKIIVANKIDSDADRVITVEEGENLAKQYNLQVFETSAKTNTNVEETFINITTAIKKRLVLDGLKFINNGKRISLFSKGFREKKNCC